MGGQNPLQPLKYMYSYTVRLSKETVEKLEKIAKEKGLSKDTTIMGKPVEKHRSGVAILIRKIVEEYLTNGRG